MVNSPGENHSCKKNRLSEDLKRKNALKTAQFILLVSLKQFFSSQQTLSFQARQELTLFACICQVSNDPYEVLFWFFLSILFIQVSLFSTAKYVKTCEATTSKLHILYERKKKILDLQCSNTSHTQKIKYEKCTQNFADCKKFMQQ